MAGIEPQGQTRTQRATTPAEATTVNPVLDGGSRMAEQTPVVVEGDVERHVDVDAEERGFVLEGAVEVGVEEAQTGLAATGGASAVLAQEPEDFLVGRVEVLAVCHGEIVVIAAVVVDAAAGFHQGQGQDAVGHDAHPVEARGESIALVAVDEIIVAVATLRIGEVLCHVRVSWRSHVAMVIGVPGLFGIGVPGLE